MRPARALVALVAVVILSAAMIPGAGAAAKPGPPAGGAATLSVRGAVVHEGARSAAVTFALDAPLAGTVKVKWSADRATKASQQGVVKLVAGQTEAVETINLQRTAAVETASTLAVTVTAVDAPAGVTVAVPDATADVVVVDADAPLVEPQVHLLVEPDTLWKTQSLVTFATNAGVDIATLGTDWHSWYTNHVARELTENGIAAGAVYPGLSVLGSPGYASTWMSELASHQANPANPRVSRIATGYDVLTVTDWPRVRGLLAELASARDAAGLDIPIEVRVPPTFVEQVPGGMTELAALVEQVGIAALGDTFEALDAQLGDEIVAAGTAGLAVDVGLVMSAGAPGDPTTFGDQSVEAATAVAGQLSATYRNLVTGFVISYRDAFLLATRVPAPIYPDDPERFLVVTGDRRFFVPVLAQAASAMGMDIVQVGVGLWPDPYVNQVATALAGYGIETGVGYAGEYVPPRSYGYLASWMAGLAAHQADPANPRISRIATSWGAATVTDWPRVLEEIQHVVAARNAAGLSIPIEIGVPPTFVEAIPDGMAALAATGVARVGVPTVGDTFEAIDALVGDELDAARAAGVPVDVGFNLTPGEPGDPTTFFDTPVEVMGPVAQQLGFVHDPALDGVAFDYASVFYWGFGVQAP